MSALNYSWLDTWATACAPFCALYAVAAANRAQVAGLRVVALGLTATLLLVGAASVSVALAALLGDGASALLLVSALVYLAAFDIRARAVPVWPILGMVLIGLAAAAIDGALLEHGAAAAAGWAAFRLLDWFYRAARGWSGLGAGDALIAAMIAAWLSFEGLAWSVALGGAAGLAWALARGVGARAAIPFAPALAFGALIVVAMWGIG